MHSGSQQPDGQTAVIIPHISKMFVSGGIIYPERGMLEKENMEEALGDVYINAIFEEAIKEGILSNIRPYKPGSVLNNWTTEEILVIFRTNSELCSKHTYCSKPRSDKNLL